MDNELPFIIFTDKEYRVIHGLAIVYLWLIDLDTIFLDTLDRTRRRRCHHRRVPAVRAARAEGEPAHDQGQAWTKKDLVGHIQEKLKYEDYLDLFEDVHRWFEQARRSSGNEVSGDAKRKWPRSAVRSAPGAGPFRAPCGPPHPTFGRSFSAFRISVSGYS